ncbi:HNH endonuclease [Priestia endophytica]|uniref:HNH endonuclease n=1 Tax=Priestia endophytica TaxID=135735 RepID=UPI00124F0A94|nr:HNH endonuclease signature motif containing protein [Priestia endophytica]KAB2489637.1 HNH endonuclease [Priestia endophytica]
MKLKSKPEIRYALWQAYKRKCAICGKPIEYTNLHVDHILAESLEKNSEELNKVLKKYKLTNNFDINSLYNLRPACSYCNIQKSNHESPKEITYRLLRKAKNKIKDIERGIKQFKEDAAYALKVEAMRGLVANGELKIEEYIDQVNNFIADYGQDYIEIDNKLNNFRLIKQHSVMLEGNLPTLNDPEGNCLFTFNSFYIRGVQISLSHKEILQVLYKGVKTSFKLLMRPYIVDKLDENNFLIQLGGCRFNLNASETNHLCNVIDKFIYEYLNALKKIEKTLQSEEFIPVNDEKLKYKLIKINKNIWKLMLEFAQEHDNYHGEGYWHIFDSSGRNMLKIYNKLPTDRYNSGFHCFIHSLVEDSHSWEPSNDVWLVWWYIGEDEEFGIRTYWTVQQTYNWLTKEFIPFVLYNFNKPFKKEKVSFEEYREQNNIQDVFYRESNRFYNRHKIKTSDDLLHLIESLQLHYSVTNQIFFDQEAIHKIYDSLVYILDICPSPDYYYTCRKLDFKKTESRKDLKAQILEKKKSEKYGKIYGGSLDILFRTLFINIELSIQTINEDEVEKITKLLEPFIEEYNMSKLVEVYSR